MDFENVITLIKTVSESHLTSFEYEDGNGACIKMKTDKREKQITSIQTIPQSTVVSVTGNTEEARQIQTSVTENNVNENDKVVKSPLVGTFYSASGPEEAPFVAVGDTVKKGQVLGIVEAMKLMNEIESEYDGVVKDILVSDASVVEFDQPMFVIE